MSRFALLLKWLRSNFVYLTLLFLAAVYLWWFYLTPFVFAEGEDATKALLLGLVLFFIYALLVLTHKRLSKSRLGFKAISSMLMAFFLALNFFYAVVFKPAIEASGLYDGTAYYLTTNWGFLDFGQAHYQLTKWYGFAHYESMWFGNIGMPLRLLYDPKKHVVSIAQQWGDSQLLIYADTQPVRHYDTLMQLENHNYYTCMYCGGNMVGYDLGIYDYTLYRCDLDNTSCEQLPFHYRGDYAFDASLVPNRATGQIDLYFNIGEYPGVKTLIYSYGVHPSCHVGGCSVTP